MDAVGRNEAHEVLNRVHHRLARLQRDGWEAGRLDDDGAAQDNVHGVLEATSHLQTKGELLRRMAGR